MTEGERIRQALLAEAERDLQNGRRRAPAAVDTAFEAVDPALVGSMLYEAREAGKLEAEQEAQPYRARALGNSELQRVVNFAASPLEATQTLLAAGHQPDDLLAALETLPEHAEDARAIRGALEAHRVGEKLGEIAARTAEMEAEAAKRSAHAAELQAQIDNGIRVVNDQVELKDRLLASGFKASSRPWIKDGETLTSAPKANPLDVAAGVVEHSKVRPVNGAELIRQGILHADAVDPELAAQTQASKDRAQAYRAELQRRDLVARNRITGR